MFFMTYYKDNDKISPVQVWYILLQCLEIKKMLIQSYRKGLKDKHLKISSLFSAPSSYIQLIIFIKGKSVFPINSNQGI